MPGIVRATDYMWSALAAQNLNSWFGVGFPISNYRCVMMDLLLEVSSFTCLHQWSTLCPAARTAPACARIGNNVGAGQRAFA